MINPVPAHAMPEPKEFLTVRLSRAFLMEMREVLECSADAAMAMGIDPGDAIVLDKMTDWHALCGALGHEDVED